MSSGAAGLWEGPSPREPFPCSDLREGSPHPRSRVAERSALSELGFSGARLQWSFSSGTPDRVSLTRPRSRRRGSNPHPGREAGPEAGRGRSHAAGRRMASALVAASAEDRDFIGKRAKTCLK